MDEVQHTEQLAIYRRNARHLLQQAAKFGGEVMAPVPIMHQLRDTRADIARVKATLRDAGVVVIDAPEDAAPGQPDAPSAQALLDTMPVDTVPDVAPFPAFSRMPYSPNPHFVGRDDALLALAQALKGGGRVALGPRAAATGLGGIGKTSVAAEFVHRYGQYFAGGVFWLSFADPAAVVGEVAACGGPGFLDLRSGFNELKQDEQVALVTAAWRQDIPRLLVFDNCEDPRLVEAWAPSTGGCRVLITSRRQRWPSGLRVQTQQLAVLVRSSSIALLQQLAPCLTPADADTIATELGDLPLALHLAGHYLARVDGYETPSTYLQQLAAVDSLHHPAFTGRALEKGEVLPTRHEQDVARTFAVSLTQLDPTDPIDGLARHILACLAALAPGERVPQTLLVGMFPPETPALDGVEALERLRALGLIETDQDGTLRIHRLVHRVLQSLALDAAGTERLVAVVCQQANALNDQWHPATIAPLLPHLRWLLAHVSDPLTIGLLHELGDHATSAGDYGPAQRFCDRALTLSLQIHGPDAPLTATSHNHLGTLAYARGEYAAARTAYTWALTIRARVLGPTDPATASTLHNLATVEQSLGDLDGAQTHYDQALAIREVVPGRDHPTTALTVNGLAGVAQARGDLETATTLYERALAIQERALGSGHPATITTLNNLGAVVTLRGDDGMARSLCEQAVIRAEQTLGPTHPSTATSLHNLAYLDYLMGAYSDASVRFVRALAIMEVAFGSYHGNMALALNNLALVRVAMGTASAAHPLLERAEQIGVAALGSTHPTTQQIRANLDALNARLAAAAEDLGYDATAGQHSASGSVQAG